MADIDAMLRELEGPSYGQAKANVTARDLLEQLEQSGDIRPNEKAALDQLRASEPQDTQEIGATDATYRGALQGATFQQADEIYGLLGGDKEGARLKNLEAEAAYPSEYNTGKTAGAIGSGAASAALTGPLGAGRTLWGTIGRGAGLGGLEGFAWGSGGATEGDKLTQGVRYAVPGAAVGLAAPALVAGGAAALRAGGDIIGGAMGLGNKSRANRAIIQALKKSGKTLPDVSQEITRALRMGQPEFRVMDATGIAGQRAASGIARGGGDGAEEIAQFLRQRQMGQPERVAQFTDEAFDLGGRTADEIGAGLKFNRKMQAKTNYAAARGDAGPVNLSGTLGEIDSLLKRNPILGDSDLTTGPIGNKLKSLSRRMRSDATGEQLIDFDTVLGIKQDMGTMISNLKKRGLEVPPEFAKVYGELDAALEDASVLYREANDSFAAASKPINAIDTGKKLARPSVRTGNVQNAVGAMTPDEQAGARAGYGDTLLSRIEANSAPTSNRARFIESPKAQGDVDALAIDPAILKERLARENAMWETQNRALGGSRTADNLQDVEGMGAVAAAGRAARDVTMGNPGTALANVGGALVQAGKGQNEATRNLISKMLMSDNPAQDLAKAVSQAKSSEMRKRIVEGVLRALGRDNASALGL